MTAEPSSYRTEAGVTLVEIRVRTEAQLFDSLDPAPFHERDLDPAAVAYLHGALDELPARTPVELRIQLEQACDADAARAIEGAVAADFRRRAQEGRVRLRQLLRTGRVSLLVGLTFLAACLELRALLPESGDLSTLVREGLSILGWVAMWKPIDLLLYAWWPLLGEIRRDERIAALRVEVQTLDAEDAQVSRARL